jgi:hypothetical protein
MMCTRCLACVASLFLLTIQSSSDAQVLGSRANRPVRVAAMVEFPSAAENAPRFGKRSYVAAAEQGNGWYPYVIARGDDRTWIRQLPIEERPNRPMHFWGNSRRRVVR